MRSGFIGVGEPAPLSCEGRRPAVLALHGFGATPLEVELVVEVARKIGLAALAPLLPGHGTHPRDLARTGWKDWSKAAESALDGISAPNEPAIVAGLSLGSLIAAHLAATRSDRVRALVMLANAAWLTQPSSALLAAIAFFRLPDFSLPKTTSDIADPEMRKTHLSYAAQPIHAAIEVLRAGEQIRHELCNVHCPTLLVHGCRDRVCPPSNAERVFRLLGSRDKRVVLLPRSRHIVTRDLERALVRSELESFFRRVSE